MHNSRFILLSCLFWLGACDPGPSPLEIDPGAGGRISLEPHQYAGAFGQHTVHVNAITTDQLTPEVASGYQITRSRGRALLNVFVSEQDPDIAARSVAADVQVAVRNLTNQSKGIVMREIAEGQSIYYIGDLGVSNGETLVFDIDVQPDGVQSPYLLRYRKQFFTE